MVYDCWQAAFNVADEHTPTDATVWSNCTLSKAFVLAALFNVETIWLKNLACDAPTDSVGVGQSAAVVFVLKQTSWVNTESVCAVVIFANALPDPLGTTATDFTTAVYVTGAAFVIWAAVLTA